MNRLFMLTLALAAAPTLAADYPDNPILFVVPFAAGSATDETVPEPVTLLVRLSTAAPASSVNVVPFVLV